MRFSAGSFLKGTILHLASVLWLQLPLRLYVFYTLKGLNFCDSGTSFDLAKREEGSKDYVSTL